METVVIVEILDSSGMSHERHKLTQLPAIVGRNYNSDVFISDPYVCPSHFEISRSEQGLILIKDLDSVNGLFLASKKRKVTRLEIEGSAELRIGQTIFRIIDASVPVVETLPFDRPGFWSRRMRFTWRHALLSLILFLFFSFVDDYWLNFRKSENQKLEVLVAAIGILMAFLPWPAVWSLIGKVNINKPRFFAHFSIPLFIFLVYWIIKSGYGYIEYAFGQPFFLDLFGWVFAFVTLMLVFYYHLLYSSKLNERKRWIYSSVVSLFLIAISVLVEFKNEFSFTNKLPLAYLVKPPWARIISPLGVSEYTDKLTQLKEKL